MQILARGRFRLKPFKYFVCGFTLLELMVVLIIAGISFGLMMPHLMKNDDDLLKEESMRLVALMEYASDSASSNGRWLAWTPTNSGYRFMQRDEDKGSWQPVIGDDVLRERHLPEGMTTLITNSQQPKMTYNGMIQFSPSGIQSPYQIELAMGNSKRIVSGNLLGKVEIIASPLQVISSI